MPLRGIRDRRKTVVGAAAAVLVLRLASAALAGAPPAPIPLDAFTLVRQALAALEVRPPAVTVAAERILAALFAKDTRGVDMPRVRDAELALHDEDITVAAAYLIEALRPAEAGGAGAEQSTLTPVLPGFAATPAAYGLLASAAVLIGIGAVIARK
jgi:hypothetical protein